MNNLSKEEKSYIEFIGVKSDRIKAVDYLNEHGALTADERTAQEALIKALYAKESEALKAWSTASYENR